MKILITGSSGYIGTHVYNKLRYMYSTKKLDIKEYREYDLEKIDWGLWRAILEDVDLVIHLAALISVPESQRIPHKYYDVNMAPLAKMLDVMKHTNCKNIIFASTAAVYQTSNDILTEDSPLNPSSIYGHSKLMAEEMLQRMADLYDLNYVIFRFFNVAGDVKYIPSDVPFFKAPDNSRPDINNHLLPMMLKAHRNGKTFNVFGNDYDTNDGTCIRDYIHVSDIVHAIELACDKLFKNEIQREIINLGTNSGNSILEVIEEFNNRINAINDENCEDKDYVPLQTLQYEFKERRVGDPPVLVASNDRACRVLGWEPQHTIKDIVASVL